MNKKSNVTNQSLNKYIKKYKKVRGSKIKPSEYYDDPENIKTELKHYEKKLGSVSIVEELKKLDYYLYRQIREKYGGIEKFRENYSLNGKKTKKFYQNFEKIKREVEEIINTSKLDNFPEKEDFIKHQKKDVFYAILKYHRGITNFKAKIGYGKKTIAPFRLWEKFKDWETLKLELEKIQESEYKNEKGEIIKKMGDFPAVFELEQIKRYDVRRAVKFFGGMYNVAKKLGYQPRGGKPPNYWKNDDNLKSAFQKKLKELNRNPKAKELEGGMLDAIQRKYGTYKGFLQKNGYSPWESHEGFINFMENNEVAKTVIEKLGNDKATMVDVFHLIYEDDVSKKELYSLLNGATLGVWLGNADYGIRSPRDIANLGKAILPFDKNEKIKQILQNLSYHFRREKLGAIPTKDSRKDFRKELIEELHEV